MKKNIVILVILTGLAVLCAWETVYLNRVFKDVERETREILAMFESDTENIDKPDTISKAASLLETWEKRKPVLQVFVHHAQIGLFTDKLVALSAHINQNDYNMANTVGLVIVSNSSAQREHNIPFIHNIF